MKKVVPVMMAEAMLNRSLLCKVASAQMSESTLSVLTRAKRPESRNVTAMEPSQAVAWASEAALAVSARKIPGR